MTYLTILDYEIGKTYIFPWHEDSIDDIQDAYNIINDSYDIKFKESNCSWMLSQGLNLQIVN